MKELIDTFLAAASYIDIAFMLVVTVLMYLVFTYLIPTSTWDKYSKDARKGLKVLMTWSFGTLLSVLLYTFFPPEAAEKKTWAITYLLSTALTSVFYDLLLKRVFSFFKAQ